MRDQRNEPRGRVALRVQLHYPDLASFTTGYSANVSEGGMFVRTDEPKPVGTTLRFEVVIGNGVCALRGVAVVRWVRTPEDVGGSPGMGLKFLEIDEPTRAQIAAMLKARGASSALERSRVSQATPEVAPASMQPPPPPPDALDLPVEDLVRASERAPGDALASLQAAPESDFELDIEVVEPVVDEPAGALAPVFLRPPESLSGTGTVIGIDLGTTNSCVAVFKDGRAHVLKSKEGYNTIPSVISLTSTGKLLVGHRARNQLLSNPSQTIYGAKRLVGRQFDSPTVREVRERFHYEICADPRAQAAVRLGSDVLSLEEVQGIILRECKEMAEQALNERIERATITVPAYYSEAQREAVRRAGALAGLKVERILNEPTAAALAFGLNRGLKRRVLVYDLGGGTFDATLLKIDDNVFEVLATAGDTFLGGVDFDNAIVDLLIARFEQSERMPFTGDSVAIARLQDAAERAKLSLSEQRQIDVHLPMVVVDAEGNPRDLRTTLTRADVERACVSLVDRTLDVVRDVLLDAELKAGEVDEILLVGGQTRMPLVRERLREMFGRPAHAGVNADEAVAIGAALHASTVDRVNSVVLVDVLPMTVGVGLPGGGFKRVLERNTPLPTERTFTLPTTRDGQRVLEISLFQGEGAHLAENEYLGTIRMDGLPQGPRGMVRVAVTLSVDAECVVHVEARELATRRRVAADLATRYSPEQLQEKLGFGASEYRNARAEELEGRAGRFWKMLKRIVGGAGPVDRGPDAR